MTIYCANRLRTDEKNTITVNIPSSDVKKRNLWFETCSAQFLLLVTLLIVSTAASLITLFMCLTKYQFYDANIPSIKGQFSIEKMLEPKTLMFSRHSLHQNLSLAHVRSPTIVTRQAWLAQPPLQEVSGLHLPVPCVIIMHTATENCSASSCSLIVNAIQRFHMDSRGWSDIGYNFLIGGDGFAYEGRGWEKQGAHTYGYNSKSIGISFIGNFNAVMPTERQMLAAKELIQLGVEAGYIAPNYKLFAARQLQATQSPGSMLYEDVQKWPHWTKYEKSVIKLI